MKTRKMRKITAAIAAFCMCAVALAPTAAFADATIVINGANSNVSLANKTFAAYKVFSVREVPSSEDGGESSYVYTIENGWKNFFTKYFETDADISGASADEFDAKVAAKVSQFNNAQTQALAKALYAYAQDPNSDSTTTDAIASVGGLTSTYDATEKTVTLSGVTSAGYYLVADTSTNGGALSAVMMDTLLVNSTGTGTVTLNLKADQPTIQKKIDEDGTLVDANTASIGDTVKYQLSSVIPDTTYYTEYVYKMTDTFAAGLDIVCDDDDNPILTAYVENGATDVSLTKGVDYYVSYDEATRTMVIDFNTVKMQVLGADDPDTDAVEGYAGKNIIVEYSVTINENATIGDKGNVNTVDLTYSNNPNDSGDGKDQDTDGDGTPDDEDTDDDNDGQNDDVDNDDDDDGTVDDNDTPNDDGSTDKTPEDKVVTYITEVKIAKTDSSGEKLGGAVFSLSGEGVQYVIKETTTESGEKKLIVSSTKTKDEQEVGISAAVDANGYLVFTGLGAGKYTITEVSAPAGFTKIETPITLTIGCTVEGIDLSGAQKQNVVFGDTDTLETCTWSYSINTIAGVTTTTDGTYTITVKNSAGQLFPVTGGIGTTIFAVVGVSMMAGAAGLYVVKRRVSSK